LLALERQLGAERGLRLPLLAAGAVEDSRVQPGPGQRQPRLGEGGGHLQGAAGVEFGRGQQQVHRALQPREVGHPHAVRVGPLHCPAGGSHEGQQHQRGAQDQAGADRAVDRHASAKR
jgi:hypothetical protein